MDRIISSESLYQGQVFNIRKDKVRLSNSDQVVNRTVIEHPGSVAIIAMDDDNNVYMVSQYRHPTGMTLMEIPAGTLNEGESAYEAAHRELREEIGMLPKTLMLLGEFYLAPGYSSEIMQVYLGTDLEYSPLAQDDDEDIKVHLVPLRTLMEYISQGDIVDMKTIASLLLLTQNKNLIQ